MHSNSIVEEQATTEASLVKKSESVVAHLRHVQRSKQKKRNIFFLAWKDKIEAIWRQANSVARIEVLCMQWQSV